MKKYAIFLPQFHEIPENNEWWGNGFTEWTNVRKALPLYRGHHQPKVPQGNRYYNLLDKEVVEWQTKLSRDYCIDGMIYYHYYFNGKLLLEKPAENLLEWKDIPQHFFFCWANHSWMKTWNGSRKLLIEQTYGNIEDWERHFQYLLPFFKDPRYEKVDNKPMFMLFKSNFIEKNDLFKYLDKRCRDEGFSGIYLIESYHGEIDINAFNRQLSDVTSLVYYREPAVAQYKYLNARSSFEKFLCKYEKKFRRHGILKKPQIYNGNTLMAEKITSEKLSPEIGHGIWFEWDNTPRHKERGYVITPYSREMFIKYMDVIKNEKFLFINAWNEWCEGMILEPTVENGSKYLEWIREWTKSNDKCEDLHYNS